VKNEIVLLALTEFLEISAKAAMPEDIQAIIDRAKTGTLAPADIQARTG
jgi:hypothetical protein